MVQQPTRYGRPSACVLKLLFCSGFLWEITELWLQLSTRTNTNTNTPVHLPPQLVRARSSFSHVVRPEMFVAFIAVVTRS